MGNSISRWRSNELLRMFLKTALISFVLRKHRANILSFFHIFSSTSKHSTKNFHLPSQFPKIFRLKIIWFPSTAVSFRRDNATSSSSSQELLFQHSPEIRKKKITTKKLQSIMSTKRVHPERGKNDPNPENFLPSSQQTPIISNNFIRKREKSSLYLSWNFAKASGDRERRPGPVPGRKKSDLPNFFPPNQLQSTRDHFTNTSVHRVSVRRGFFRTVQGTASHAQVSVRDFFIPR